MAISLVAILALAGVALAANDVGNNQLSCAWSAALARVEADGTHASLYQRWYNSAPPAWFATCTATWAACDTKYGSTPVVNGAIARVKSQGYVLIGAAISNPRIVNVTLPADSATVSPPSSSYGTAHGFYADLAGALWANIATHYSFTTPVRFWFETNLASPANNNLIYNLNNAIYDIGMGNIVINGTWVDSNSNTVARTSLVQFPSCAYNADADAFLQGNMALPGSLIGTTLTTEVLKNATLSSTVTVCVQAGTTYDINFVSRGFAATKTTRSTFQLCGDAVAAGTVNVAYSSMSALTILYNVAPSSFKVAPFEVVDAEYNAFAMFRFDSTVNAASSMRTITVAFVTAIAAVHVLAALVQ